MKKHRIVWPIRPTQRVHSPSKGYNRNKQKIQNKITYKGSMFE